MKKDRDKIKLFAAIGGVVSFILLMLTIAFAIGFGGAVGWPLFILFALTTTGSSVLALYAWYLNGWY